MESISSQTSPNDSSIHHLTHEEAISTFAELKAMPDCRKLKELAQKLRVTQKTVNGEYNKWIEKFLDYYKKLGNKEINEKEFYEQISTDNGEIDSSQDEVITKKKKGGESQATQADARNRVSKSLKKELFLECERREEDKNIIAQYASRIKKMNQQRQQQQAIFRRKILQLEKELEIKNNEVMEIQNSSDRIISKLKVENGKLMKILEDKEGISVNAKEYQINSLRQELRHNQQIRRQQKQTINLLQNTKKIENKNNLMIKKTQKIQIKKGNSVQQSSINQNSIQVKNHPNNKYPHIHQNSNSQLHNLNSQVNNQKYLPETNTYANSLSALKYKIFGDLFTLLKPNYKQTFIRLIRCTLKKKDILFKNKIIEVGLISYMKNENQLQCEFYLTNISDGPLLDIKFLPVLNHNSAFQYIIQPNKVDCIQQQDQYNIIMLITNKQSPFLLQRAVAELSFWKDSSKQNYNIFIPFLIPKCLNFPKPEDKSLKNEQRVQTLSFKYNEKVIPKNSYLFNYFENAQEVQLNKFKVGLYHKKTGLSAEFRLQIKQDIINMRFTALGKPLTEHQSYIFQEFVSFMQIAFRK